VYFNSIPQTYTDLVLVISGNSAAYFNTAFRLNSDNGNNYSWTELYGTGSVAASGRISSNSFGRFDNYGGIDTTGRNIIVANFMNYSNSTTYKTVINRSNNAGGTYPGSQTNVNLWRNTAAITSINVLSSTGANFSIGSTFTLYGIKVA
jgi:hypothetical protein